jgi:hypothetical protein
MPLGASAAVVNASIMPEKSMCGFFHNRYARVSERGSGDSGKGQNCSLLLVIGKPETESRSDVASLLKTESNGPILPSAVINWDNVATPTSGQTSESREAADLSHYHAMSADPANPT